MVQIAKAEGAKVIASAGSDEKVEYVKTLGADVVFNYEKASTHDILEKEGPVNMYVSLAQMRHKLPDYLRNIATYSYWDNVGGEALEAALEFAAQKATFIVRFCFVARLSACQIGIDAPPLALACGVGRSAA